MMSKSESLAKQKRSTFQQQCFSQLQLWEQCFISDLTNADSYITF
jgi:hypothetical protein